MREGACRVKGAFRALDSSAAGIVATAMLATLSSCTLLFSSDSEAKVQLCSLTGVELVEEGSVFDLSLDQLASNETMYLMRERYREKLNEAPLVDFVVAGETFNGFFSGGSVRLEETTQLQSFLLHFDSESNPSSSAPLERQAKIAVDFPIIGVAGSEPRLLGTDEAFGVDGVIYADGLDRGADGGDFVQIAFGRGELSVTLSTDRGSDQLRFFVHVDPSKQRKCSR